MKNLILVLLASLSLSANPLIVREPAIFNQTVSIQVDFVPIGSNVTLETCNGGEWQEVLTVTNTTAASVVFCLPLTTNRTFRAFYLPN